MLTLARLLYRPTLALWCAWSRVYRRIWHHRYRHLAVWSNADLPTVARVLRTVGWALGYYNGCDKHAYVETIAARWEELASDAAAVARMDGER